MISGVPASPLPARELHNVRSFGKPNDLIRRILSVEVEYDHDFQTTLIVLADHTLDCSGELIPPRGRYDY
jgi:hypothetical protein